MAKQARHRFAPLGQKANAEAGQMQLQGIIFDMDGTLCMPQNHMFKLMRDSVSIPADQDILDYIHSLPPREQDEAFDKIKAIESQAMAEQVPQAGLVSLMEFLDREGVKKGICTRNFDAPVTHLLQNHIPSHINPFSPIVTRDFRPPKPSPAALWHIARAWGLDADEKQRSAGERKDLLPLVMVGDSIDDITAGHAAGALTVLLRSSGKEELEERADVAIDRLDELIGLLKQGLTSQRS